MYIVENIIDMSDAYVLIKEYPGSPKLGTIVSKPNDRDGIYEYDVRGDTRTTGRHCKWVISDYVENFHEFWQLQEKVEFTERDIKSFAEHCIVNSKSTLDDAFRVWKAAHGHK